jgi:hypothetical protein
VLLLDGQHKALFCHQCAMSPRQHRQRRWHPGRHPFRPPSPAWGKQIEAADTGSGRGNDTAECDGGGRFKGRLVAVVVTESAVFVVGRLPRGQSSWPAIFSKADMFN